MKVPQLLPAATTPVPGWSRKLLLLPLLLFLLRAGVLRGLEAEERPRTREGECHFYAGGQVYPGEASRVSVADHSLHLSKAKSRWCPANRGVGVGDWLAEGGGKWGGRRDMCALVTVAAREPGSGCTSWVASSPWAGLALSWGWWEEGPSCEERDDFH